MCVCVCVCVCVIIIIITIIIITSLNSIFTPLLTSGLLLETAYNQVF